MAITMSIGRLCCSTAVAAAIFLATSHARAQITTIGFEEFPPNTVITTQYQHLGVVFGPPGFLPHAMKVAPGEAHSGTMVASISCGPNCGVEFPVPFVTGTFID